MRIYNMPLADDLGYGSSGALSGGIGGARLGGELSGNNPKAIAAGAVLGSVLGAGSSILEGRRRARYEAWQKKMDNETHALNMELGGQDLAMGKLKLKSAKREEELKEKALQKKKMISEMFSKALASKFRGEGATNTMGYI